MSFFYAKKKGGAKPAKTPKLIPVHHMHEKECGLCYLNTKEDQLETPKFDPSGPEKVDVYILGDMPSKTEDATGRHFSGDTSSLLRNMVPSKYKRKVRYNFTSRCRSLSATPNNALIQTECCRPSVERDIEQAQPKIILGVGNNVLKWALGKGGDMNSWRGRRIPVKIGNHKCWFVPIYDPTIVHSEGKFIKKTGQRLPSKFDDFLKKDIVDACKDVATGKLPPVPWIEDGEVNKDCAIVMGHSERDLKKLKRFLEKAKDEDYIGLDLETTDLRPYSNGRIISCSVTTENHGTLAFPVQHKRAWRSWSREAEREVVELFNKFILESKSKIWHNLGFDMEWLQEYFGHDVFRNQRYEDTMIMAYILDSRKGVLGLDQLCRIHLGLWLKDQSNVDRKNMESEPLDELLNYNALDTKFMFELFFVLKEKLENEKGLIDNYEEMLRSANMLVLCQDRGLNPDFERLKAFEIEFDSDLKKLESEIAQLTIVKQFKRSKGKPFSPTSNHDVAYVLDTMLDLEQGRTYKDKSKKTWSYTTDEGCLNAIRKEEKGEAKEIATLILKHRGIAKMLSTYILSTYDAVHADGLIHTNYSQTFTSTGRLNSSEPNSQNYPKRKNKRIREIIGAPRGFHIVSADYGQIEARVFAMASKDKAFMDALWTGYDVHQAWALKLIDYYNEAFDNVADKYEIDRESFDSFGDYEKKVVKTLRGDMKNGWVFPQFFGSSPYSCAASLDIPTEIAEKMAKEFWETFSGVKKWQEQTVKFYKKHGYVQTLTGKRRYGPLSHNEIINTPIQGTAATIVLNAMNELSELALRDENLWHLQPNLNIHDDITLYLPDKTIESDIEIITKTMVTPRFDFINVPLVAEVEIGEDWCNQYVYGEYSSDGGWVG